MIIQADELLRIVREVLCVERVRPEDADLVAQNLVDANLAGHDTHGVARLPRYVKDLRDGGINVDAKIKVQRDGPGVVVFDGDWCFGQVVAMRAVDAAIEKARTQGVAVAGVFNSNDVGRLGAFTYKVAQRGFFGLMTVNDGGWAPWVAPWGSYKALFSTNPISAAAPGPGGPAFCVDMATGVCAASKVKQALARSEPLEPGMILDAKGKPSINPKDLFGPPQGAILTLGAPAAGHKGLALNLIIDVLSGALTGAGCSANPSRDSQGIFLLVINIEAFGGREAFVTHTEQLLEAIQNAPRQDGADAIRIPGHRAETLRKERLRDGIFIEDPTWSQIRELATERNITAPTQ
ncbi:MAG: Ldh family oxidoreductase [Phycisphaeraceae bacterium]|jgi:LDH2 family malate/lactate/ureidoglycolate dehydrogenase|nr:Ldh family oxidoreductase [Phycisphaeraceae bacterium]